ncbi:MAG: hypothetical protein WCO96_00705 [Actinomycetes bacterium]
MNEPPYPGSWRPNPVELGYFAQALAKRYDGNTPDPLFPGRKLPAVNLFEAWNEPNYKMFLAPQCTKGTMIAGNICTSGGKLAAPEHYRLMLNEFFKGVKNSQPSAVVIGGALGPYGNSSQGYEIDPQVFARSLLCLGGSAAAPSPLPARSCPVKVNLDGLSFHPYTLTGTPTTKASSPNGGALGNAPDLRRALDRAASTGSVLPAGRKVLWETETGWMTCPPCRSTVNAGQAIGVAPDVAARYTAEMIYRAWSWGVDGLVWYGILDSPTWPAGLNYRCALSATTRFEFCPAAGQSDAVAKPSLAAFRFPLFSAKTSSTMAFSWVLSPCKVPGSTVRLEVLSSRTKKWSALNVPGPVDPKTKRPTSIPLTLTLPAGTDGTAKSAAWTIPTYTTSIRATASGTGCSTETSIAMPIASK